MKTALYILFAFYITTLSVVPCGDQDDCNESKHSEQTSHEDQHQEEACPPFCHCACCGTTFLVVNTQMAINKIEIVKANSVYSTEKPTSIPASIWQPPKIA